jgi:hypothetical protein
MIEEEPLAMMHLRKRRADRRAQRLRVVLHALRVARTMRIEARIAEHWAKQNADNLKPCSCWMCGHVRKWSGPPFREIRRAVRDDE